MLLAAIYNIDVCITSYYPKRVPACVLRENNNLLGSNGPWLRVRRCHWAGTEGEPWIVGFIFNCIVTNVMIAFLKLVGVG